MWMWAFVTWPLLAPPQAKRAFIQANEFDTKPTITHAYASACSKKALVARNVASDVSSNERDG
ncbi:hypothetical protein KSD_20550 [Ktedonobacter sp. SOSP1-85]|nr:hypothetical protein KSD_20550 [Ktedonobacter sp. SOSP1-85]